jgi:hypothetical protein
MYKNKMVVMPDVDVPAHAITTGNMPSASADRDRSNFNFPKPPPPPGPRRPFDWKRDRWEW